MREEFEAKGGTEPYQTVQVVHYGEHGSEIFIWSDL